MYVFFSTRMEMLRGSLNRKQYLDIKIQSLVSVIFPSGLEPCVCVLTEVIA